MNDKVRKMLEESGSKIVKAAFDDQEKKRLEKERFDRSVKKVQEIASKNGDMLIKLIFKEMINRYGENELSIGKNSSRRFEHCIRYHLYCEDLRSIFGTRKELLADVWNNCHQEEYDKIFMIKHNPKEKYKTIVEEAIEKKKFTSCETDDLGIIRVPIKFDSEKIRKCFFMVKFRKGSDFLPRENSYSIDIDHELFRNLTTLAYNNQLEPDGYILDREAIKLLKEAYIKVSKAEKAKEPFLEEAIKNAEKIYEDIYDELIKECIKKPNCGLYEIKIEAESIDADSKRYKKLLEYNEKTALLELQQRIYYLPHKNSAGVVEYIPVYTGALHAKLIDDKGLGFKEFSNYAGSVKVTFNGNVLVEALSKAIENTNKNSKTKKRIKEVKPSSKIDPEEK